MAESSVVAGNIVKKWENKFFDEYVRNGRFNKYMGEDEFALIQVKEALVGETGRDLSITLINRLTGAGKTGKSTLKGNEEKMDQRTFVFIVDRIRHAVLHDKLDEDFSAINLVKAKNSILRVWFMENLRDAIIDALGSISVAGAVSKTYADADDIEKDAWLVDNADRVLFGAAISNNSSDDHSASLSNIDNTNDKFTAATLKLMKRRAETANPRIRPVTTNDDEEWFVVFAGSNTFRDFSSDSVIQQANREAWQRGKDNPLFTGGDLLYDGMIIRKVPDIADITGVGAGSIDVGPVYLCGAQAIGICWKRRSKMIEDIDDYGAKKGAGFEEIRDVKKLYFGKGTTDLDDLVQHGVHTGYFASVADA